MSDFARNRVAIVGCAQSPIVKSFGRPVGAVTVDVAREAIADAGLRVDQVDGFVASALVPTAGDHAMVDGVTMVTPNWLAAQLGVNPSYATGFQGYGQLPGSVSLAVNALATGAADHVVVHRALHNPKGSYHSSAQLQARGQMQWTMPQGFFGPLPMIGMAANEYAQRYGATREDLGAIVVEARKNGSRIPWSVWHGKPLDMAGYLDAPLISDPVCRFDCDMPVDGVAAFVLTTAERAADLPNKPVYVAGYRERRADAPPAPAALGARRHLRHRRRDGPPPVGARRCRPGRRRPPAALRRVLALRVVLARGARPVPGRGGAPVHRRRRDRQRRSRRPARAVGRWRDRQRAHARRPADARVLPAAVRSGGRAPARGSHHRRRMSLLAALRWRRRVQRRAGPSEARPGLSGPPSGARQRAGDMGLTSSRRRQGLFTGPSRICRMTLYFAVGGER
jgi:hypothetical protein